MIAAIPSTSTLSHHSLALHFDSPRASGTLQHLLQAFGGEFDRAVFLHASDFSGRDVHAADARRNLYQPGERPARRLPRPARGEAFMEFRLYFICFPLSFHRKQKVFFLIRHDILREISS